MINSKLDPYCKEFIPKFLQEEKKEEEWGLDKYLNLEELSNITILFEKSMKTGWGMGCVLEMSKSMIHKSNHFMQEDHKLEVL